MHDDINTKRTELANQMAAAGAANLDFTGTAAVLAAIPDTEPQQYVAAGTAENIAAILPATICPQRRQKHGERPTEPLQFDSPAATSGDAPDLQQLKALALAATPGEWMRLFGERTVYDRMSDGCRGNIIVRADHPFNQQDAANLDYIAAANPAVVLGLIARIESNEVESYRRGYVEGMEEGARLAVEPATASGDELPPLSDAEYQSILGPVLSREGMRRYRNADPLSLDPSDLRAMINRARAAVSAATKPTADLSKLTVYKMAKKQVGDPTHYTGAFVRLVDVESLLATKPAAVPAVPEGFVLMPKRLTQAMRDVLTEGEWEWPDFLAAAEVITEDEYNQLIGNYSLAASTTGAAQTAEQVRDQALEDAAALAIKFTSVPRDVLGPATPNMKAYAATGERIADGIRALKRPTPTHSSEAGDA